MIRTAAALAMRMAAIVRTVELDISFTVLLRQVEKRVEADLCRVSESQKLCLRGLIV
jgi:hypothetical protein